jgi:CheY-like chemotaxis protein
MSCQPRSFQPRDWSICTSPIHKTSASNARSRLACASRLGFLHARLLVYCAKSLPFTPPKPLGSVPEELKGSTVLIVDDERAWRVILETDLQMLGYRVSVAEDAVEALERAERDQPAVAIIDLMLPEPMDGRALCAELRARGIGVPVVFYTAYPVFDAPPDDPGILGYMSKAVDRADLYSLLPEAIRRQTGAG